jgi:hypothetical protein
LVTCQSSSSGGGNGILRPVGGGVIGPAV